MPNATERTALAGLVERVLAAKQANPPSRGATADKSAAEPPSSGGTSASQVVAALEREIDDRVYRLYGLTKEEVKLVEESTFAGASARHGSVKR
jgi:hypothetical protein